MKFRSSSKFRVRDSAAEGVEGRHPESGRVEGEFCEFRKRAMQLRFFQIPAGCDESASEELNRFLRTHRVLQVDRHLTLQRSLYGVIWRRVIRV